MKKRILLFVAVVSMFATVASAQVKFGVKAGANIANMKYKVSVISLEADAKTGLVIGAFAQMPMGESWAFQPEVLYAMQGSQMDDVKQDMNYISIPLMIKKYWGGFNVQFGPQIGLLMSAKDDGEDVKESFKGTDFGISTGLGYDLEMGLGFDLRYYSGMSNISDASGDAGDGEVDLDFGDVKIKNRAIQLTVTYAF